ncbi:amidase domain-containing protein [uncultured Clostridium sp.]|uniref:amidase domain-containing protein n=1 Tax=uncultured Clostridium sp. TaxID=59620 RepID=UPI0025D23305|nr:amidase domain-containing protein [uncultured Clostridium sp.]MDU4883951.1 amidase domain-containing protein [Clostridium celatum]MDU7077196.1 amidase domain-containing protein [Clostridium celatum]
MDNLLQKKNRFLYKITSFILIILNLNSLKVNALDPSQINIKQEITNVYSDTNDELKQKFQPLVENIFLNRNSAILTRDCEGLKVFYDLDKKVGKWAYENEVTKTKYFTNWCEKQCVSFTKINSIIKVSKVKEIEKDVYNIICYACTKFCYSYEDEPNIENYFKLGTCHYINLKKDNDKYIIIKEWYTDPLADSLDLNNIECTEIKSTILSHKKPDFTIDERTQKAIDYAHEYCGISDNDEHLFKYNKEYKNFNPDGGDCANFASQIMFEGGGFKKNSVWNYCNKSATNAWINAQGFKNYLINSGRGTYIAKGYYCDTYKDSFNLRPGDIVAYEKKGRITHVSTVTGLDSKGYPLVTCHNTDRMLVPYDLGWSNNNIKFHFIDVHY